jgi:hypothetical protein
LVYTELTVPQKLIFTCRDDHHSIRYTYYKETRMCYWTRSGSPEQTEIPVSRAANALNNGSWTKADCEKFLKHKEALCTDL